MKYTTRELCLIRGILNKMHSKIRPIISYCDMCREKMKPDNQYPDGVISTGSEIMTMIEDMRENLNKNEDILPKGGLE